MKSEKDVKKWIKNALTDPITSILIKNNNLTQIQLETLLIDLISNEISDLELKYENKIKLRLNKERISRGAFNRTLFQARRNVIRSIYTLILLGYLGVLETPRLEPYLEISNRLETYMEKYKEAWNATSKGEGKGDEDIESLKGLKEKIREDLEFLSNPKTFSPKA